MSALATVWLLLLLLLPAAEITAAETITGVVRAVYDGDTVLLATRRQNRLKVRLYGIDAPENDQPAQPYARVSKRTLMYKIMGRQVFAEIINSDQYNRSVAVIRYEGRDINREMITEGMAWAYRQYLQPPYASGYIEAEEMARARHRGLWHDPGPQPPWEFRQAHKPDSRKGRRR